jgi:NADH:ubiquinone oxidoreductase subunit 6 (subunit J)
MYEITEPRRTAAPKILRVAAVVIYVQAIASIFVAAVELSGVVQQLRNNQDVPGLAYFGAIVEPLVAILLVMAAASVWSKRTWARSFALCLEALVVASGVVNLFSGHFQGITQIVIAVGVVVLLSLPQVGAWIAAQR